MEANSSQEFFVLEEVQESVTFNWTIENTLILLDLYKKYRSKVGTFHIKNFKQMWEVISTELETKNIFVSPSSCVNRWRALERNYKRYIANKRSGATRNPFAFAKVMEELVGKDIKISPVIVLNSSTISKVHQQKRQINDLEEPQAPGSSQDSNTTKKIKLNVSMVQKPQLANLDEANAPSQDSHPIQKFKYPFMNNIFKPKKYNILEKIRQEKIERNKEKRKFEKEKLDKFYELEKQKLETDKNRNTLLQESNELKRELISVLRNLLELQNKE